MKTKLFTLLLVVAASVGTMFAWDHERFPIGDLYYNLDATNHTAQVTNKFEGSALNYKGLTSANIPASVTYDQSYLVTSIGNYAFKNCSSLTSVTIPASVDSIGEGAFFYCTGLTSVTIPASVDSIGEGAFVGCTGLTSINVASKNPNYCSVNGVLFNKNRTTLISYPGGKQGAYSIPNSVTSIGDDAFYNCSKLTSVTIPNSVTSIGSYAFYNCSKLTSVTIPNSVTSIGSYAFGGCTGLTSVKIPNSVTSIGDRPFQNCTSLTLVTIGNSVTSIGEEAFRGCTGLTSVTIGNSVTSIGTRAFDGCSSLTSVTIPNSVTSIGYEAFDGCTGLTSVTIGNSVTSIGWNTFSGCTGLTSLTIGNSVTIIGDYNFNGCRGLTSVTCFATRPPQFNIVFDGVDKSTCVLYVPAESISAYQSADGWRYFTNILPIEETPGTCITASGTCGAQGDNLTWELSCDSILTIIGTGEMANYSNVPSVPWYSYNSSIQYVVIGNNVTSIGSYAFGGCTGLTSVTIPNSVTSIEEGAFQGCTGLTSVTIEAETPPTLGSDVFYNTNNCPIYVPCGTLDAYKSAWSDCADRIQSGGVEYTIIGNVNDAKAGSVDYPASACGDVVITAVPNNGYHFTQWSDGNTDNPRIAQITKDTTFTATFAKNVYTITKIANSTQGSISGVSQAEYLDNITLTVNPNYGYHFTHWSDGNTENPRTILLTQDTTFIAEFAKNTYSISTSSANPEWGTAAGGKSALYLDEIEISATPNYGYHFAYWNIEKYRELIDISSLYTVKFSVPNTWSNPYAWIWETGGDGHWETLSYEKGMYVYRTEQNNMNIIVVPNGPSWGNGQTGDLAITESCCYTISGSKVVKSYDCLFTEVQIDTITTLDTRNPLSIIVASNLNATAKFAKNTYSITTNAEHGTISGNSSAEYLDQVTLSVSSDYGYHFTQWSDGNTENPRTFVLTRDTTFTAEFAIDKSGTCGKNNLLQWTFADDGTLTISGSGELTENYTFGVEAPTQMQQLVVGNEVTAIGERAFYEKTTLQKLIIGSNVTSIGKYAFASINSRQLTSLVMPAELLTIGDYAFSGNTYLESIDFNAKLQSIGAYAFKDCYRVSEMTCLATATPDLGTDALASINSYASLCVPAECLRKYQVDPNWGRFDLCSLGTTSTVTDSRTVTVEPSDNTAIFTWPTENNAASYSLQITKDGVVFCTLVFNSNGQLTGIAFAPGRNGAAHAPAATMSVAGMSFTVTGLDGASKYAYRLAVTNDASEELVAYSGEFATTGYDGEVNPGGNPDGIEDVFTDEHKASKILHDDQIFILRGEKVYTLQGQEIK